MKLNYYLPILATVAISCTGNKSAETGDAPLSNHADKTTLIASGDPEMAAAMAKARATLPEFWKHAMKPGPREDSFALKVPVKDGDATEYFWLNTLSRDGTALYGVVANDPEMVHNVKVGDRRKIAASDIVDWMYYRNNKIVGNYTVRALFKNMSPSDVKDVKAQLAEP